MTRKYNTKHPERGRSNYGKRLIKRHLKGFSKTVTMESLESLRKRQGNRNDDSRIGWADEWTETIEAVKPKDS